MNKIEFLAAVSAKLDGLAPADVREQIGFLSEMIDDRMEEGITEAEAVAAVGAPDEVAARILADLPFATVTEAPAKPKKPGQSSKLIFTPFHSRLTPDNPIEIPLFISSLS